MNKDTLSGNIMCMHVNVQLWEKLVKQFLLLPTGGQKIDALASKIQLIWGRLFLPSWLLHMTVTPRRPHRSENRTTAEVNWKERTIFYSPAHQDLPSPSVLQKGLTTRQKTKDKRHTIPACSPVVTDSTTNMALTGLSRGEQAGIRSFFPSRYGRM